MFARFYAREFSHDAIAFNHHTLIIRVGDDPFAALDLHGLRRVVVDGDEIDERIRAVFWRIEVRHENDAIDRGAQSFQFANRSGHVRAG